MRRHGGQAPLVGRGAEVAELDREFRRCLRGEFRCVLIEGEAGIGKTRLAADRLAVHQRQALTLRARAYASGAATSFALWGELLDGHLRGRRGEDVTRLCGGFVDDLAGVLRTVAALRGGWRLQVPAGHVRQALTVLLGNLAQERPVILFMDDLHLADASSWETLGYVAGNLPDARVLVLGCGRPGDLVERSVGRHVLFGLEQDGVLTRMELDRLSMAGLRELAERVLGRASVPVALVDWLLAESQGNPLFAVSLLDAVRKEDADLAAPRLAAVPRPLADRIAARLETLDASCRQTLDLLAVLGRPAVIAELRELSALSHGELPPRLQTLVEAGLVAERADGGELLYEVSHPLVQEAIYNAVEAPSRRVLHRRVARVLAASGRLSEAAPHYGQSATREDPEAVDMLVRALGEAWSRHTFAEAFVILGSVVNLLAPGDERWGDVVDALPPNAEWTSSYNRIAFDTALGVRAFRAIEQALRRKNSPDPGRLALINSYLAGLLAWCLGQLDEAAWRAADAAELFRRAGDWAGSRAADVELAWVEGLARRYASQDAVTRRVLATAEAAGDRMTTMAALGSLAAAAHLRGDFPQAWTACRRMIALARATDHPARARFGVGVLSGSLALAGELDDARRVLAEATDLAPDATDAMIPDTAVRLSFMAGDFAAVADDGPRVAALSAPMQRCWLLAYVAMAAAEVGDTTTAHRHLATIAHYLDPRPFWVVSDAYQWALGTVALAEGRPDSAVPLLDAAATAIRDTGLLPQLSYVLTDLAEAAWLAAQPAVAGRAAEEAAGVAARLGRDHFQALAGLTGSAAALALADPEAAGDHARRAVTLLSGRGYQALEGRGRALLGRSLIGVGRGEAIQPLRQAAELFTASGSRWRRDRVLADLNSLGHPGQRVAAACLGPASLTRREREVAALAVQGLTAKAIGERLHIGVRTTETHLARVYAKFGVHSRQDFVRAMTSR